MFRMTGWRLFFSASWILLEKGAGGRMMTESPTAKTAARQIGTVVSFMHRRGYGFIRELDLNLTKSGDSGAADAAEKKTLLDEGRSFFFPRSSLNGGFYVEAGQTVAFDVRLVQPSKRLKQRLADGAALTTEEEAADALLKELSVAHHIRLYDTASRKERPVTPIMLVGYVENWDPLAGTGVIAELDLNGALHDDSPRFTVSLEDLDLTGNTELGRGRFVRFCLESGDRTAARRVIIDRGLERKRGAQQHITATSGIDGVGGPSGGCVYHYGTVRETVEGRFGFIVLDETGESLFFHMSNTGGSAVKPGDTVSFILREVTQGKHTGKKTCLNVQKCTTRPPTTETRASTGLKKLGDGDDEDDEFDLLD